MSDVVVYDAIHGYMHFEQELVPLLNSPSFQRLKQIKQLAAVHHVFPCATHTRFEHSLGVGHLAGRFAHTLSKRHPELDVPYLAIKLAGMAHDLGHGTLSHAFDRYLEVRGSPHSSHEQRGVAFLQNVVSGLDPTLVDHACHILLPSGRRRFPLYVYQIIHNDEGGVDADRLDYLRRDARTIGLPQQDVDVERFLEYSRVVHGRLCFDVDRIPLSLHRLVMARHEMHALVYQHRVVRAIEHMYTDVLDCLDLDVHDLGFLSRCTDALFTSASVSALARDDGARSKAEGLLHRIAARDLYRCILDVPGSASEELCTRASGKGYVVDVVRIGFETHPLHACDFVDRNGALVTLCPDQCSGIVVTKPLDVRVRAYAKRTRGETGWWAV
jgi:deoxynucleoside triphosphate triphosphohydrolase SAMHD1